MKLFLDTNIVMDYVENREAIINGQVSNDKGQSIQ